MKKKIPVIVVSGFLGSGKTTFLRYLLKESNKKTQRKKPQKYKSTKIKNP